MKTKRNLLMVGVVVGVCLTAARFAISIPGSERKERTYEVEALVATPEYRTDAARAIDAYERLMERYMDLAEGNFIDRQEVTRQLHSIDSRLNELSMRIARIENAMGIEPNVIPAAAAQPAETKEAGQVARNKKNQP